MLGIEFWIEVRVFIIFEGEGYEVSFVTWGLIFDVEVDVV